MQLALDTATWDLELDSDGNILTLKDGSQLIAQRIQCRLQTFRGECFLDRSIGVPYFQEVMKKNPDLGRIRALLASVIAGVEGVSKILSLVVTHSAATRHMGVAFRVQSGDGTIAEGEV